MSHIQVIFFCYFQIKSEFLQLIPPSARILNASFGCGFLEIL